MSATSNFVFTHKRCEDPSCAQCDLRKKLNSPTVAFRFAVRLVGKGRQLGKTWLTARVCPKAGWGVGCKVCLAYIAHRSSKGLPTAGANLNNSFGSLSLRDRASFRTSVLRRHSNTLWHQTALAWAVSDTGLVRKLTRRNRPGKKMFKQVAAHVRAGNSRSTIEGIGSRHKVRKFIWCLAEALRIEQRGFLRMCSTIGISEDKKDCELSMRFSAATSDLQASAGYLGTVKTHGGHINIVQATLDVLKDFCTPNLGRPVSKFAPKVPTTPNDQLLQSILTKIEFHASDAEPAMMKAARKMQGQFPNLKVGMWDLAHGFTRITSRPWKKDPVIADLVANIITNRRAIVKLVQYSSEFTSWFLDERKKDVNIVVGIDIKNFSYAGHRFDSTSRPLRRAVLGLGPLVRTAMRIITLRRGTKEAKAANTFLEYINTERALLMAMVADAADEANMLMRLVDKEDMAVEDVPLHVRSFLSRIETLFQQGRCLSSGFTAWMLDRLKVPLLFFVNGTVMRLGHHDGVPDNIVNRCMSRLAEWTSVAKEVVRAEFPDFLLVHSMQVFSLTGGSVCDDKIKTNAEFKRAMERLTSFFGVDKCEFMSQYLDFHAKAMQLKTGDPTISARQAWQTTLQQVTNDKRTQAAHPSDALEKVLVRYIGWTPSSCGLERNFASMSAVVRKQALGMGHYLKRDIFTIVAASDISQHVLARAQKMWLPFGNLRASPKTSRIDKGISKTKNANNNSEISFLRKRRADVLEVGAGGASVPRPVLSEWAKKEITYQTNKRRRRMVIAGTEGQLLMQERRNVADEMKIFREAEKKNDKAYKRDHESRERVLNGSRPSFKFAKSVVFLEPGVGAPALRPCVKALRMCMTPLREKAEVFVVVDCTQLGQHLKWILALMGGTVIDIAVLRSSGERGVMLHFEAPTKKQLWCSPNFAEASPSLVSFLGRIMASGRCTWTWLEGTLEDYGGISVGRRLALVTCAEKRGVAD